MADKTANQHQAGQDASRFPGLIAHSGTAGTADTSGTAEIVRVGANPATGALYVQDLAGGAGTSNVVLVGGTLNLGTVEVSAQSGGTNVNVVTGTQQTLGTVGIVNSGTLGEVTLVPTVTTVSNLTNGSVRLTVGTITTGSLTDVTNLYSGSVRMTVGTITTGSITDLATIYNLNKGTITRVETGTLAEVTLVPTVTTVSNVTNGTVRISVGTITTGSLSNVAMLNAGTVVIPTGTITTGSLTNLASLHTGTIQSVSEVVKGTTTLVSTVTTLSNLTTGSIVVTSGTLGSVGALAQVHNAGTIQAGTVQINSKPVTTLVSHGTLGTAGGSFFATISAASGVGTNHWVTNVDVVMQSGTADVRILAGTAIAGTGVIAAGFFPGPGGGIAKHFMPAFSAGANSELTYHFVGAGTAFITVNYFKTLT